MTYLSPKDTKIKFNSKRCTLLLLKMIIKNYFALTFFSPLFNSIILDTLLITIY